MNNEVTPETEAKESVSEPTAETIAEPAPEPRKEAWISILAVAACIIVYVGLLQKNDYQNPETLASFGYLPAFEIWRGGYWALLTSAFVHFDLWHVGFNAYWLWILGSRVEKAIGSFRFLIFVIVSATISSSFQLAVSDTTGIGASGVVYAIFGFMWPTRHRWPKFQEILNSQTILMMVLWLVGCVILTSLKIWEVGNAAHISGLLFGSGIAAGLYLNWKRALVISGLVLQSAISIITLFWCPWSVHWLSYRAYEAHASENYQLALERYNQVTDRDPDNAWALYNRSYVYRNLGQHEKAGADLKRARELDPALENSKQQH